MNTEKEKLDRMINRPGEIVMEDLIQQAFHIFSNKLAYGGIVAKNEFAFQFELGSILKTLGQLYEFNLNDKFHLEFETTIILEEEFVKSNSKKARIDILIIYQLGGKTTKTAIELKFFKKENHREPNNRYDVFKDIANLESYKRFGIDICYFLLLTDHTHYVNQQKYSTDTADFDFRQGQRYMANTILSYRTPKSYGPEISLSQDYEFKWKTLNDLYFLKLKV
ncbi:hypothetical protein M9Q43_05600 [Flavobacterium sp. HXWNR29]|uniref:hypothetical protein n=1 Tax=Flavobacterium odoriferum TaxID=2946604 RepID=UPI0021CB6834|nr:hypothetical protein [Flavobacterium sp. HXWNR29]MCU4188638.1 hypothetical protein [Flavobacterium sp. HXWNR29]